MFPRCDKGIFQILDKLEEAVDALLNTSSSLSLPLLEVKTKQKPYGFHCALNHFLVKKSWKDMWEFTLERNSTAAPNVQSHLPIHLRCKYS